MGFVVDKVALGQVFSKYFSIFCQLPFHQMLHPHRPVAGTVVQIVNDVTGGLFHPTPRKKIFGMTTFQGLTPPEFRTHVFISNTALSASHSTKIHCLEAQIREASTFSKQSAHK
jgi:hypothetical protein